MTYKSIIVHLDIDGANAPLVTFASDLAGRFGATLIGVSSASVPPPLVAADGMVIDASLLAPDFDAIEARLAELEAEFRELAGATAEWRGAIANPTRFLIGTARAADIIVTSSPEGAATGNADRRIDLGNLVLAAGRPILIAADGVEKLLTNTVMIAWKDTREARRAVADALPLLTHAQEVIIATADRDPDDSVKESLADVAAYVRRHGVKARTEILTERDEGHALSALARSAHVGLVVSGGFGHSRFREWAFGGVTRSFLDETLLNRLISN